MKNQTPIDRVSLRSAISAVLGALCVCVSGCVHASSTIPEGPTQLATASYSIIGETTAKDCNFYVFIPWSRLFSSKDATVANGGFDIPLVGSLLTGLTPEASAATYLALESVPTATHLVAPRIQSRATGFVLFGYPLIGTRCAEVHATAVKVGPPVPNAH